MVESNKSNIPSDWRKAFLDDNNFEQIKTFDYELCVELLEEACKDMDNLNPYLLMRPIWEITKGFRSISSALSVGFSDLTTKVQVWRDLCKSTYTTENSINEVIKKEMELNIHELNGENNKEKGHKKKTQYYEYVSATRTLLRLIWFLDFFTNILSNAVELKDKSFKECVSMAYDKCLAPHHPWLVRKGAGLGISLSPSKKEKGLSYFFGGKEEFTSETIEKLNRWRGATLKLWTYLNGHYEANGLLTLP